MTQTTAITEIIQTLADVESRFNIMRTESEGFFPEWYADLPEITEVDKAALNLQQIPCICGTLYLVDQQKK